MKRRTADPEAIERARKDAMRRRVEAGLPAEDPEELAAEERAKSLGGKFAVEPSGRVRFKASKRAKRKAK